MAAAEADDARDAMARYDTTTPGPGGGHGGPVSRALALAEALCSCAIEHISADPAEVALADLIPPDPGSPAAVVVAARDATVAALAARSAISAQALLRLHATLARGQDHAGPGRVPHRAGLDRGHPHPARRRRSSRPATSASPPRSRT